MHKNLKAITLTELLIAVILMTIVVLGLTNIDLFSRFHLISADRRATLQNETSYILEHMAKEIDKAIGNTSIAALTPISITTIQGDDAIRAWIDFSGNGQLDPYPTDREIAYRFTGATGAISDRHQIWYYANCVGPNCNQAGSIGPEVIVRRISAFNRSVTDNCVVVQVSSRWDPDVAVSTDNPEVTMRTEIKMPSVSTN